MLAKISMTGFKSFENLDDLEIKPLTILCGENSCGKSSLLQSILLLKQSHQNSSVTSVVKLNGDLVKLGSFKDASNSESDDVIGFKYEFSLSGASIFRHRRNREQAQLFRALTRLLGSKDNSRLSGEHRLLIDVDFGSATRSIKLFENTEIHSIAFSLVSDRQEQSEFVAKFEFAIQRTSSGFYQIRWETSPMIPDDQPNNIPSSGEFFARNIRFDGIVPQLAGEVILNRDNSVATLEPHLIEAITALNALISSVLSQIKYIGPLRNSPQRHYVYKSEVSEIGTHGENAALLFNQESDEVIEPSYFPNRDKPDQFDRLSRNITVHEAMSIWSKYFGLDGFQSLDERGVIDVSLGVNDADVDSKNIRDVGFGVSQLFPILLEGIRMRKNSTLLLEQPEVHLHPALQMKMTDFFISLMRSKKYMVVETHSDHIVNRLVRRIVEDKSGRLGDNVAIYYVKSGEAGSVVDKIDIDPLRGIVNWPIGFFDQTADEQRKIVMAGIEKRLALKNLQ